MNILLVEDHEDACSALKRILARWGHDVVTAHDVITALSHLKNQQFDAIVSDIALADGTGYELMYEARRAGVTALGIAISAYPYPAEVREPKVTGFDYHISKPLVLSQLRRVLEKVESGEGAELLSTR